MSSFLARRRLGVLLAALACAPAVLRGQQLSFPFQDRTLPIDKRVDDLVARMTLEEKASQLVNRTRAIPRLERARVQPLVRGAARRRRRRHRHRVPAGDRAGGHVRRADASTRWPQATAREARVKYNQAARAGRAGRMMGGLTFFSPNINIFRDPRWGRGQETYGEDPFLTGRLGVAFITGLQGDDPDHPVVTATAKHYAVHCGPEPLRHGFDAKASAHDIEDTYLPAFRDAVVEGKVEVGDVRLQRHQRRARLRQRVPARRHAARAVEVRGLRHRRLRRRARHRDRPQVREVRRRGRGRRDQGRPRQRLHDQRPASARRGAARLPALHRRGEAGPADRGRDRRGAEAHAAHALRAGPLRPAGDASRRRRCPTPSSTAPRTASSR